MAEIIACPNCGRKLQVPEAFAGQTVQCPDCRHTFPVGASAVSAEPIPVRVTKRDDDDDDEPPRRRRRRYDDDDEDNDDERISRYHTGDVPTYMTQAILVTVCCSCWPLGIVAIINAAKVNSLLASGDFDGAVAASEAAKMWCWISFGLGMIVTILWIGVQVKLGAGGF